VKRLLPDGFHVYQFMLVLGGFFAGVIVGAWFL